MAELITRRWTSTLDGGGLSRKDRQSGNYTAYLPDLLINRPVVLDGDTAADIADAEAAIAQLDTQSTALLETEALARLLLRAEAVASSRIEGLEIGARRLLRAEVALSLEDDPPLDGTAIEVLANIEAMAVGVHGITENQTITLDLMYDIHRRLLAGTQLAAHGGVLRDQQNWIGGSSYNPCSAAFVPPPPEHVAELMIDLCAFCNRDDLPAVAQAAIAHAQFETIHPFIDGNGRTGRALIHLILRRRGLAHNVIPPVSLVLATWAQSYIDGLTRFRHLGEPTTLEANAGLNLWVARFAAACSRAASDASAFESQTTTLEQDWRRRLGAVRANSATDLLLRRLPGAPVLTVATAAALIGRTYAAANIAIERLVAAQILKQVTVGRRNRAFESPEVIAAFTNLERQLASPDGDTLSSPPERRVPHRQQ